MSKRKKFWLYFVTALAWLSSQIGITTAHGWQNMPDTAKENSDDSEIVFVPSAKKVDCKNDTISKIDDILSPEFEYLYHYSHRSHRSHSSHYSDSSGYYY